VLGWSSKSNAAHALTRAGRTVADLSSLSQHHQHQHRPAPPSDNIHRGAYAPCACTRSAYAIHAAKEGILERDTYHQLDLLGRAAVGVGGGCRVAGFALAVHGGALQNGWI
jgi:hypothetical protein